MVTFTGTAGNDTFAGGNGADTASGNGGSDTLSGGGGSDSLNGGDGEDRLYSGKETPPFGFPGYGSSFIPPLMDTGREVDRLNGGAGQDLIFAGYGDHVDGGADLDYLYISFLGAPGGVTVDFGNATQTIGGGTIKNIEYVSWIDGSDFSDVINARQSGPAGYSDFTAVFGHGGNDRLVAGYYTGSLDGGSGDDIVDGRLSQYLSSVAGGPGDDIIYTSTNTLAIAYGGSGNDTIYSHGETYGGSGDDLIILQYSYYARNVYGEDGDDDIRASSAGHVIFGGAGNDILRSGTGWDVLNGGDGTDTVSYVDISAAIRVYLAKSGAQDTRGGGRDTLVGIENAIGGSGSDTLSGTSGANRLEGGSGNDRLYGQRGDDTLVGGGGNDFLDGGDGGDTADYRAITGALTVDLLISGAQNTTTAGNDTLVAIENLLGGAGGDTLRGSNGANLLDGGSGNDQLFGRSGNDTLSAGDGNDLLDGGDGNDLLDGGAGVDRLEGGKGDDVYVVDTWADVVLELSGQGHDTVRSSANHGLTDHVEDLVLTGGAHINGNGNALANAITGNAGNNVLDGRGGADTMAGGKGHDRYVVDNVGDKVIEEGSSGKDVVESSVGFQLPTHFEELYLTGTWSKDGVGNYGDNKLVGNSGHNLLNGLRGVDRIDGGAGNDMLYGSEGDDVLIGGSGQDKFLFNKAPGTGTLNAGVDRILDFSVPDDIFYLANYAFTKIGPKGALNPNAFHKGTDAADAADRIVYDQASGSIYYDPDGSGAAAKILFATVTAGTALTSADFHVYG